MCLLVPHKKWMVAKFRHWCLIIIPILQYEVANHGILLHLLRARMYLLCHNYQLASLKYPGQPKSGIIPHAAPSLSVFAQMCQLLYYCMANTVSFFFVSRSPAYNLYFTLVSILSLVTDGYYFSCTGRKLLHIL